MAHACRQLRRPPASEDPAVSSEAAPSSVVVRDPAMLQLHELAARAAAGTISVLLLGETGCGKEILADTIHNRSPRLPRDIARGRSRNCRLSMTPVIRRLSPAFAPRSSMSWTGCESRAKRADYDFHMRIDALQRDLDFSSLGGEFDRVVHQVSDHLLQA